MEHSWCTTTTLLRDLAGGSCGWRCYVTLQQTWETVLTHSAPCQQGGLRYVMLILSASTGKWQMCKTILQSDFVSLIQWRHISDTMYGRTTYSEDLLCITIIASLSRKVKERKKLNSHNVLRWLKIKKIKNANSNA